jgi:DNA-binding HxlR family transcriptional regulator
MIDKENEDLVHDQKIDEILKKHAQLDDVCREIFLTLQAYERLRFNELRKYLKKFGTDLSKPVLIDHLNHLIKQKLISRKRKGSQNVSYGLTEEIYSLTHESPEDLAEWLEVLEDDKGLPEDLKSIDFDVKAYFEKMSEKQLDQETDRELKTTLALCLFELKNLIGYDLKIDKQESDAAFWNFIGNPFYRMHERIIAETCRESERYKDKLFEKIATMINQLRSHKSLRSP